MRLFVVALLLAAAAAPVSAQSDRVDRRVQQLEEQMRAVQRKVFPAGPEIQPEIGPSGQAQPLPGVPASSAIADLTARVDALEAQLAQLTGQAEENAFRLRQLEEVVNKLRTAQEAPPTVAVPSPVPEDTAAESTAVAPPEDASVSSGDAGEDAYNAGYRLWEAKRYADAEKTLEAMAAKYPKHRKASWARNLAGRAYLDEGKPASAAKVLLANYQTDPKGERAADSLYFLGQALMQLKRAEEACQVYAELEDVYGSGLRDYVRDRLPKARADAKCK